MNFNHKSFLVTGANRGIGQALVEALLEYGAKRIYATARQVDTLQALCAKAPDIVIARQLDITDPAQINRLAEELDNLDVLINNAGIATGITLAQPQSRDIARAEMETHFFGVLHLTQALLPLLRQSPAAAISNVSSIAGIANFPLLGPYSASKAALHSLTQGLRAELKSAGILVQGVYPGPVDTRLAPDPDMPKASTAQVAERILLGLVQGQEDIYPDDFSQAMMAIFAASPKKLEQQFAAALG